MIPYFQDKHLLFYLLIFISSFAIAVLIIPAIIRIARSKHLYDDLGHLRKIHNPYIPRLGGVAIFISFILTLLLALDHPLLPLNCIVASCVIIFTIGIQDDLTGLGHRAKFAMQLIAATLLVIPGSIRLSNLQNLFGLYELAHVPNIVLSILFIIFIVNAFNLIDGIDCLAAATGIFTNLVFFMLFIYLRQYEIATVSLAMVGAILGFLKYNISPAKIFMGDTGSLLIGLVTAVMAIKFIEVSNSSRINCHFEVTSSPSLVLAILIGPVADTMRVFLLRLAKRQSPFLGDRNHIHHRITELGFTHLQTTAILIFINAIYVLLAFAFSGSGNTTVAVVIGLTVVLSNLVLNTLLAFKLGKQAINSERATKKSDKQD